MTSMIVIAWTAGQDARQFWFYFLLPAALITGDMADRHYRRNFVGRPQMTRLRLQFGLQYEAVQGRALWIAHALWPALNCLEP
ncbi:hypothetical protein ABZW11_15540 [Nonomuraea sp. NPDC004580]|uniref:hypothetical protein n=1 Tax=Nonomuraea sp. NPDC004580 TaxID=3154552 RepID=UPI0033BEFA24